MADFVAVLRKTIDGMGNAAPAARQKVYDKARATIENKLAALNPPPSPAVAERQRNNLEDAIREVEAGYSGPVSDPAGDDPFAELEREFSKRDEAPVRPGRAEPRPEPRPEPRKEPQWASESTRAPVTTPTLPKAPKPQPALAGDPARLEAGSADDDDDAPRFDRSDAPLRTAVDDEDETNPYDDDAPVRRRGRGGLVAAAIALLVVAGGGYAVWLNLDDFRSMLGVDGGQIAAQPEEPAPQPVQTAAAPPADQGEESQKFTQRLNADGTEVDDGPAGGNPTVGEGTSVAAVTQIPGTSDSGGAPATPPAAAPADGPAATPAPTDQPAATDQAATPPATPEAPADATAQAESATPPAGDAPTAADASVAVAQKAIFYEERTNVDAGSADNGSIVWSLVQQSPGGDLPAEPAIRAEATIPGKDVQLRMTISRNMDKTLPASHIIELIFLTPDNFDGGGIESILRFTMKDSEQATGSPLLGIPAKIADGFFLVALNDTKAEAEANVRMLQQEKWIDIPVVYKSGRRALFTMEKGLPGEKVFADAIKAWQAASATTPG